MFWDLNANSLVSVRFQRNPDSGWPKISGHDLTDPANDPRFYTTSKKGVNEAWKSVFDAVSEWRGYRDILELLEKGNVECHKYYAMD